MQKYRWTIPNASQRENRKVALPLLRPPDVPGFEVPTDEPSRDFALRLLEQEGVILLPGSGLGEAGEGFLRAALTVPCDRYSDAALRIARAL